MDKLIKKTPVKSNVETGNGILLNYHWGMGTQQERQHIKVKMVNVAVDWSTNLHAVANECWIPRLDFKVGSKGWVQMVSSKIKDESRDWTQRLDFKNGAQMVTKKDKLIISLLINNVLLCVSFF